MGSFFQDINQSIIISTEKHYYSFNITIIVIYFQQPMNISTSAHTKAKSRLAIPDQSKNLTKNLD